MVKLAVVVEVFPQASVAVKVTEAVPVAPHRSLSEVKLLLQETVPQSSVALAPPLLASHAFRASVFPAPSHSTLRLEACVVMVGAVVSTMVMLAETEEESPQASVAVKVTVAVPVAPQPSESPV